MKLAQQATLETRDAKHEPRTLTEQRTSWHHQAAEILGGPHAVERMVRTALHPETVAAPPPDDAWINEAAGRVLAVMEHARSTWQLWHVRAEAERQVRMAAAGAERSDELVGRLVSEVLDRRSVSLARPSDGMAEPATLCRGDGTSVYTVAGSDLFTSTRVLAAEQRLVAAASCHDGRVVPAATVEVALLELTANGAALNAGQVALVRQLASSGARVQLAIAPAGAGKTTAMRH